MTLVHGHRRTNGRRTPTYNSWRAAIERCTREQHPYFADYGGRGIRVCDRWRGPGGFVHFLADMGERPAGKTLDRVDVNGDYELGNCRWSDAKTQRWNRRDMAAARAAFEDRRPTPVGTPASDMPF